MTSTAMLISLSEEEQWCFDGLKEYLTLSKHLTIQKRVYSKAGEFHFYDASCLEANTEESCEISIFRCGPDANDFYCSLVDENDELHLKVKKSSVPLSDLASEAKKLLRSAGETARERISTMNNSHPVTTPYGFSLWSQVGAQGTLDNFVNAVDQNVFSQDFSDYCCERSFCLKYRARKEQSTSVDSLS